MKFPKIKQFHQVLEELRLNGKSYGLDRFVFTGYPKIHGSNGAIVFPDVGAPYFMNKERVIDTQNDNQWMANFFVKTDEGKEALRALWGFVNDHYGVKNKEVIVYGEWVAPKIACGTAINTIDRGVFVIFSIRIVEKEGMYYWDNCQALLNSGILGDSLFCVRQVKGLEIIIEPYNTESLNEAIQKLNLAVQEVDEQCPFARDILGLVGHGEGLVFGYGCDGANYDLAFKVKGKSHTVSKIGKIAKIEPEVVESIDEWIDSVVTEDRLQDLIAHHIVKHNGSVEYADIGDFSKRVINDVLEEEGDSLLASELPFKETRKAIGNRAVGYYRRYLVNPRNLGVG